ncbi:major facilitator superfamily transporter [Xylariales sp. PMI_506]|nr:major facilitator superfamily transporter [Xylariales sp. PMI_506]
MGVVGENVQRAEPLVERVKLETTQWQPSRQELWIMVTLSILSLMVSFDSSIIATSLNAITVDIDIDSTQGFWIGTSYLLVNTVSMPLIASLSNVFGRPICLMSSLGFFALGSLLCSLAKNITSLLVGRCLQGIGGGGIMVLSLVIFTDIVPLRFRPKWYGTVLGAWTIGTCGGPIIGGAIAQYTTWRWIFYMMFPFCGAGSILVPLLVSLKPKSATIGDKMRRVDWLGSLFFILSTTLFLVAISWGGVRYSWYSTATLVPLLVGTVGLLWTVIYETFLAGCPFLHLELFCNTSAVATYICGILQGLLIQGQLYYIAFFFESVMSFTPVYTGLAILAISITLVPGSIVTGILVTRTKNYRYPIWAGWIFTTIASGLTILWGIDTPRYLWVISHMLLGFGHGMILNAQSSAAQAMCQPGEEGHAAAMYGFLRQFGMALGVGVGGSAFQNTMSLKLKWEGLSSDIAKQSESFVAQLLQLPADGSMKIQILDAYAFGFRGVFSVFVGIAGLGLLFSLLIKRVDMDRDVCTEHQLVDRQDVNGDKVEL